MGEEGRGGGGGRSKEERERVRELIWGNKGT